MTNETAIHRLLLVRHRKDCTELLAKALDMAIEALSAQPERKGEWILVNGKTSINCSYCYHCSWSLTFEDTVRSFNYCPNCGADMRTE